MFKKLVFISIMSALTLFTVGCGQKKSAAQTTVDPYAQWNNPAAWQGNMGASTQYNEFRTRVVSGQFAASPYHYYFDYMKMTTSTTYGIFKFTKTTVGHTSEIFNGVLTGHKEAASVAALRTFLTNVVNSPSQIAQVSATHWRIQDSSGTVYGIDTAFPVEANPVLKADASGNGYILQKSRIGY